MRDVAVVGVGMTRFGKHPEKSIKDLVREAVENTLADAGLEKSALNAAYVGSGAPGLMTGQEMIKAQVTLCSMGIEDIPMYNVENACASSSTAFNLAYTAVGAGQYDCALVVGFEKLFDKSKFKSFQALSSAVDMEMLKALMASPEEAERVLSNSLPTELVKEMFQGKDKSKSIFMDMYAFYGKYLMKEYGLTQRHYAQLSVKAHKNGAFNPHAQHQKEISLEEVLNSGDITFPLTRMMCSPVGDGASAAIVCSKEMAAKITTSPIWVASSVIRSGKVNNTDLKNNLTSRTSNVCYEDAGIGPEDIDVIEVHDASSPSEIGALIDLNICPGEEAARWIEEGELEVTGHYPCNTSGGLTTKGHPIGATGCSQIYEIVNQLRGSAGKRQVSNPKIGMTQNGGGIIGTDAAAMALHVFKR